MSVGIRTKLWTREEYDRLVAAGAFHPMARLQLVQGEIVEMAPQSAELSFDEKRKHTMYAAAGVPEYWILNLVDGVLEVYRAPQESTYGTAHRLGPDDRVSPLAAPGHRLRVADLLP